MTRTKALLVVGCIMLALAVLAVLELRQDVIEPAGQVVTGLINKDAPPEQTVAEAEKPGALSAPAAPKPGALVPLDQGTLRPDESMPAALPTQATTESPASPVVSEPAPATVTPTAPSASAPSPAVAPATSPAVPTAPSPAVPPATSPAVPTAPSPAVPTAPSPAVPTAQAKPELAAPPVLPKTEQAKPEPATPAEQASPAVQPKTEQNSNKSSAMRAIDTAGPVKVEKGQKAIVWTRLELSGKNAIFRLSGAEKVEGKAFALPDPDRYVVDLQGDWAMRLPAVPQNAFIKKIRVGKYGENTRMVLDLSGARNCQMVRINPTTLEFRIR